MKRCLPLLLAAAAAFATGAAHADIVSAPGSIVSHGSYVTDTVDHLDWYRFDNAANTRDISFDAALASFAPLGWSAASLAQVQGLQTQFGWFADTAGTGINANFSLTDAMAGYLGYTGVFFTFGDGLAGTGNHQIRAMTGETFYTGADLTVPQQQITLAESFDSTDARAQTFLTGDHVSGDDGIQGRATATLGTATWLVRASMNDGGCTHSAVACDIPTITPVPEPETWALTAMGLIGLFVRRRRLHG